MLNCFVRPSADVTVIPITFVVESQFDVWMQQQPERIKTYIQSTNYKAKGGATLLICDGAGQLERVLVGKKSESEWDVCGQLATSLPRGVYRIDQMLDANQGYQALLAWGLGSYQFTLYKKTTPLEAKLCLPEGECDEAYLEAVLRATYLVRDLINTPAEDMTPADIASAAAYLADEFGAEVRELLHDDLLTSNYPAIHAVGRASEHPPRLIDLRWGNPAHPKVTLVGKGVCFDSGGLNLKNMSNMSLMKKDMAGAAHVLGLARIILSLRWPICLRVLIPAVENVVSGNAYRPGDVIVTRKGLSVEITNTDAEGRVVLSDALYEAACENPELILDFASLTGAARVALGTDISALFTADDKLANDLLASATEERDPVWRLPLYAPYKKQLDSKIADLMNSSASGYGGAIVAALFLREFVGDVPWAHFDIMAWNLSSRPAAPEGGEAMALRAAAHYLRRRFAS